MKIIETKVYSFDELSDDAKENAREWAREHATPDEWWDGIYEDAKDIGLKITSFDLDRNRHAEGTLTDTPLMVASRIIANHGDMCDTHKLASAFLAAYTAEKDEEKQRELCEEFERDLIEEYSIILQKDYEHMYSDEYVDELISANGYTFTETGKRFG